MKQLIKIIFILLSFFIFNSITFALTDGGYNPICYPEEVTQEMIEDYKRCHKS